MDEELEVAPRYVGANRQKRNRGHMICNCTQHDGQPLSIHHHGKNTAAHCPQRPRRGTFPSSQTCFLKFIVAIIAAAAAFSFDGPNLLLVPSCVIAAWDLFYLVRSATIQPKTAAKMDGFTCGIAIGFAVIYCIIVFGNVGLPCQPGADPHWCSNVTKDSAAEGLSVLLLFPLVSLFRVTCAHFMWLTDKISQARPPHSLYTQL